MTKDNETKEKARKSIESAVEDKLAFFDRSLATTKAVVKKQIRQRKLWVLGSALCGFFLLLNYIKVECNYILPLPLLVDIILWVIFAFSLLAVIGVDIEKNRFEVERLESKKKRYVDLFHGRKDTDTYFDRLVGINVDNLGDYYTLVKQNTAQSFKLSAIVGVIGFAVLIAGLAAGYLDETYRNISYATAGAGAIIEMISGVFFWLYNRTVIQLKEYHDSLIDVQNILLSFKLIEDTKDVTKRAAMIQKMIEFLVSHKKVAEVQSKK